jgi:hypothetical protein
VRCEVRPDAVSIPSIPCDAWRVDGARLGSVSYPTLAKDFTATWPDVDKPKGAFRRRRLAGTDGARRVVAAVS